MNYYQPYYQNNINPYDQNRIINPNDETSGQRDLSTIELVNPNIIETRHGRIVDFTKFTITDAKGYEKRLNFKGADPPMTPWSRVYVSIAELDRNNMPMIGAASMEVHNIVPLKEALIVRGHIGWDSNLRAQLSVFYI